MDNSSHIESEGIPLTRSIPLLTEDERMIHEETDTESTYETPHRIAGGLEVFMYLHRPKHREGYDEGEAYEITSDGEVKYGSMLNFYENGLYEFSLHAMSPTGTKTTRDMAAGFSLFFNNKPLLQDSQAIESDGSNEPYFIATFKKKGDEGQLLYPWISLNESLIRKLSFSLTAQGHMGGDEIK